MHDRGTSILLGRPLAIAPSDANTPRPSRSKSNSSDISEHFVLSAPIAEIQADIINSLYAPTTQNASSISRHAIRISKSMVEFRRQLPEGYKLYFNGTENWSTERRAKLVQDITEDQGLTLLKIGITRILLLRALFSSKELDHHLRQNALVDGEFSFEIAAASLHLTRTWQQLPHHTTSLSFTISSSNSRTLHSSYRPSHSTSQLW